MNEWKLGYLAGLIDGEGCIYISRGKSKIGTIVYQFRLSIANTDLPLLQYIQRDFSGNIQISRIASPYHKQCFILAWFGAGAKVILAQIYDKLFLKKEQAKLALDFPVMGHGKRGILPEVRKLKEIIYLKMKELNKKGISYEETLIVPGEEKDDCSI